jgi:hypothetical protein
MTIPVLIHVSGEDPVRGEIDEMPSPNDTAIIVNNPRTRDGKDLRYLLDNVVTVLYPMHRINYIEFLPSAEEEQVIGFVRE